MRPAKADERAADEATEPVGSALGHKVIHPPMPTPQAETVPFDEILPPKESDADSGDEEPISTDNKIGTQRTSNG